MGFLNKVQNMFGAGEDEYEDEYYDDEQEYEDEDTSSQSKDRSDVSSYSSTSSYQSSYTPQSTSAQTQNSSFFKRNNKVVSFNQKSQLQVVVYKPISYREDTTEVAKALLNDCAVVLNLERTPKDEAIRIRDFLSGVAFSKSGTIRPIAKDTYIIAPENVELSGEHLFDEFENNGVYF